MVSSYSYDMPTKNFRQVVDRLLEPCPKGNAENIVNEMLSEELKRTALRKLNSMSKEEFTLMLLRAGSTQIRHWKGNGKGR